MTSALTIHAFPGQEAGAQRLAGCLGVICHPIFIHTFPDGESLVRVEKSSKTAVIYCSLARPNEKLITLCLAAGALRDSGVQRLILVAPYMCYMRQDTAFEPGQAISQQVIGALLASRFDRIITVDPHLHRTKNIETVFPGTQAGALSSTGIIADYIAGQNLPAQSVIFGPDRESEQWVSVIAKRTGMEAVVADKTRLGDRQVNIKIASPGSIQNRPVIVVDDICTSAGTLTVALCELLRLGATNIRAIIIHALCDQAAINRLISNGLDQFISTDTVINPTNRIEIAALLAAALKDED